MDWCGIKRDNLSLQVVEKNEPKKPEVLSPRDLVAKKKATIVNMYIEKGQQLVDIHDHVEQGQKLVSGIIGTEGKAKGVAAKGEVWGETWYLSHVELPLKTDFNVFSGKEQQKYSILLEM